MSDLSDERSHLEALKPLFESGNILLFFLDDHKLQLKTPSTIQGKKGRKGQSPLVYMNFIPIYEVTIILLAQHFGVHFL